jgi:hypothetical protein
LATFSAFSWMKSRRGSTTSPISRVKISSVTSASSTLTCSSDAVVGIERGFPQLLGVHFAQALVARDRQALAAGGEHGVEQLRRPGDRAFAGHGGDRRARPPRPRPRPLARASGSSVQRWRFTSRAVPA